MPRPSRYFQRSLTCAPSPFGMKGGKSYSELNDHVFPHNIAVGRMITGKDLLDISWQRSVGYRWTSVPKSSITRTALRNIIHFFKGPNDIEKEIHSFLETFNQFSTLQILEKLVSYTNSESRKQKDRKNDREILPELLQLRSRSFGTSKYCFDQAQTLTMYCFDQTSSVI
ncbi:hypothetical protein NPIL_328521 [Nephila pilipes]|uniref:Uncharacterized protein n=1 Tax=Nephila pilipes TaxID=299642 RepID=A0A8X6PE63_NEPPI|nr:hypothetical protein NPIL_328521 [Nephila pilipes]